ncbi:MAG: UDP-N-acetylmuramoyl-L-alanine--D-glutamate ligase, partial [Chloroflexota bacterium]|nr:UDP-N-acetylmuramoyl-L-alanine--D-glutamate ligase [Chloroflexota bacterium]
MTEQTAQLHLRGRRALLIGLGLHDGGTGVVRYLARAGAAVTVTDRRDAAALDAAIRSLDGLPVTYRLGGHAGIQVRDYDLVVRNPAVPTDAPLLVEARAAGIPVEMEMTLFLAACPTPVIGVTGTKGKTTTALWIGAMLRQWKPDAVIAGNMGISALDALPAITPQTPVVLELSSFQLEAMGERGLSPPVAVITNLSPDHLDRYPTFDDYAAAKWAIARYQTANGTLIVPAWMSDDARTDRGVAFLAERVSEARAQVMPFGALPPVAGYPPGSWWIEDADTLLWTDGSRSYPLGRGSDLALPGAHNRINACAAAAAALASGAPVDAVRAGLRAFRGTPHRYEDLGVVRGVRFINDTAATAPAAAVVALQTTPAPVILLAGGSDKGLDFTALADAMIGAKAIILFDGRVPTPLAAMLHARGYA